MVLLEIFFDGLVRLSSQSSPNLRPEPGKTVLSCRGVVYRSVEMNYPAINWLYEDSLHWIGCKDDECGRDGVNTASVF